MYAIHCLANDWVNRVQPLSHEEGELAKGKCEDEPTHDCLILALRETTISIGCVMLDIGCSKPQWMNQNIGCALIMHSAR